MAIAGKSAVLKISTTAGGAGVYTTALGVKNASINIDGTSIDVAELPATYHARIQGLKDGKLSCSGFYTSGDTTGQVAIRAALLNDTELWYQFLPDGATGFKQQARVSKFNVDAPVDGVVGWSCDLEGTSVITLI